MSSDAASLSAETAAPAAPLPAWIAAIRAVSRALGVVAAGLILLSIGVICQMVFVRSVLGQSSIWQTEFVTFAIIASTFLGAPYILITRGHVAVDIVPLMIGQRARRVLHLVGSAIGLVFCGFFLWSAVPWAYEAFVSGQRMPSIWQPRVWIPYATVPIGLAVLCAEILAEAWLVFTRRELPFGLAAGDSL